MSAREGSVRWLRAELLSSRLSADEALPETIRWIDCDEEVLRAGGSLVPGRIALSPRWVGTLWRWRLADLRPLVATCTVPDGVDAEAAETAALELDLLAGGTLDAIRILPAPGHGLSSPAGPEWGAGVAASDAIRAPLPAGSSLDSAAPAGPATVAAASAGLPALASERRDKIRGALLGLAVGDCLGAPVENWPAEKIAQVHGAFRDYVSGRGWGPGLPTRETVFALMWFRELAQGRSVHLPADRDRLAQALARWVTARPRDFGHLTRGILRAFADRPPVPVAREMWERAHRLPEFNAALSRAAAIGAAIADDQDLRWASAIAASAMTHPAPVCLASAVAVAEGVAAAVRGDDPLDAARAVVWEDRAAEALNEIARGWRPGGPEWNGHERGHPLKTLQAAFWATRQSASFEDVLLELVHTGGDADTHCAVAGALLGARDGAGAIPARWIQPLQVQDLIERLLVTDQRALQ